MADIFIYNGDSFLPNYLPGLIGYGQRGANGNIGATGSSVHYSSLNVLVYENTSEDSYADASVLTSDTEHINKEIIDLILSGKELSNNRYSSRDVEYMVNDIILDRTGKFYIIKEIDPLKENVVIRSIDDYGKSNYSIITNTFTGLNVYCSTTFLKSDSKKWIQPNMSFSGIEYFNGTHSPKVYHAEDLGENIFGNFINFTLSYDTAADISKYTYKFVLVFPNGQTLESYSTDPYKTIFVDNKLVFGWFDTNGWTSSYNFSLSNLKRDLSLLDTNSEIDSSTNQEISNLVESHVKLGESLKCRGAVYDEECNSEISNKANTVLCSFFIKHNCTAYAEVIDTESGVVYRIDMNDIFISKEGNQITNKRPVIEESVQTSNWVVNNYNNYGAGLYVENADGTPFNPMHSYVFIKEEENIYDADDIRVLSEDGFIENVYFTDAAGLGYYTGLYEWLGVDGNGKNRFNGSDIAKQDINGLYEDLKNVIEKIENFGDTPLTAKEPYTNNTIILQPSNYDVMPSTMRDLFISSAIRYQYDVIPYNMQLSQNESEESKLSSTYVDCNRTIKLKFKNTESLTINVVFMEQFGLIHPDTGENIQYPLAMVYIGYIDKPLVVPTYYYDENNVKQLNKDAGIYYLTKFVPPGYAGYEEDAQYSSAGMADITINITDFDLNPRDEHFIEIGITLIDTVRPDGTPRTREEINRMHTSPLNGDFTSTFLGKNNSSSPELKIYVSKISSIDESYVEEVKPEDSSTEEDLNIFNNIKKDTPKI